MNPVIDPDFSVYSLVERVQTASVVVHRRRTMSVISYEIESALLIDGAQNRVFVGFQYLSRFLPQEERYRAIAAQAESVFVFGVPDVRPPAIPNVHYLLLSPGDLLAKEWFLICYGAGYCSALATRELSQMTDPDPQRRFRGLWTFDDELVGIMHDWLSSAVDARPLQIRQRDYRKQVGLMGLSLERLTSAMNGVVFTALPEENE